MQKEFREHIMFFKLSEICDKKIVVLPANTPICTAVPSSYANQSAHFILLEENGIIIGILKKKEIEFIQEHQGVLANLHLSDFMDDSFESLKDKDINFEQKEIKKNIIVMDNNAHPIGIITPQIMYYKLFNDFLESSRIENSKTIELKTTNFIEDLRLLNDFFPAHWDPKLRIPRGQVVAAASIVSPKY